MVDEPLALGTKLPEVGSLSGVGWSITDSTTLWGDAAGTARCQPRVARTAFVSSTLMT